jgi:beta-lactamase regulating signal transducer with metallopeptidase domain
MIAMFVLSALAALLVWLVGRRDKACDPRLTAAGLLLLAAFPVLWWASPKWLVLPVRSAASPSEDLGWSLVAWLWLAGSCVMTVRLGRAAHVLHRWQRDSRLLGWEKGVEIRGLAALNGPVAAGVWRPIIFVPEAWPSWPERTRRIVLAHEMAHHRRRDPLWRWIAEIAGVVHGGNPLVRWMTRCLAEQCEFACDRRVVGESQIDAGDYARLLCDLADDRAPRGPMLAMAERSSLENRVQRLMQPRKPLPLAGVILLALPVILAAVLVASVRTEGVPGSTVSPAEVETRWSANPFPGEN